MPRPEIMLQPNHRNNAAVYDTIPSCDAADDDTKSLEIAKGNNENIGTKSILIQVGFTLY